VFNHGLERELESMCDYTVFIALVHSEHLTHTHPRTIPGRATCTIFLSREPWVSGKSAPVQRLVQRLYRNKCLICIYLQAASHNCPSLYMVHLHRFMVQFGAPAPAKAMLPLALRVPNAE
jgi:hypothetical protein